jgi:hypothetical protein
MQGFPPAQTAGAFTAVRALIMECSIGEQLIPVKAMMSFPDGLMAELSEVFLELRSSIARFMLVLLLNYCF